MITQVAATVAVGAFRELRSRFRGALIQPGEEAYAETRRVWNGAIDRRPLLIARCVDADDVVTVLRFAGGQQLPISVRGSGRGVTGHAVADGAIMIDLTLMKGVLVDSATRQARAAAGATWGEFDLATHTPGRTIGARRTGVLAVGAGAGGTAVSARLRPRRA